jgi:hypothetical protein
MRKTIQKPSAEAPPSPGPAWFSLEGLAEVEITSEAAGHPIEAALVPPAERGWRAAEPGEQTIRLLFDEPHMVRHIHLEFQETERRRTQEFVLRWSTDRGRTYREIVRQQYNFAPPVTTSEIEDYQVELERLSVLELRIRPEVGGEVAVASLKRLLLA